MGKTVKKLVDPGGLVIKDKKKSSPEEKKMSAEDVSEAERKKYQRQAQTRRAGQGPSTVLSQSDTLG